MATKRKAGSKTSSKKGSSPKLEGVLANDPPIVVSGGGGGFPSKKGMPARNNVTVGFSPRGGPGLGHFQAQTNGEPTITSVQVSFPGTGVRPVTISNLEFYTIEITFITDTAPRKRGGAASQKGKAAGKRPAARKRK